MSYLSESDVPSRAEIDASKGRLALEFGTDWCGHCQAAQAPISQALSAQPGWTHIKVEDGPGRKLGRSFRVKLWPTLVLLQDGQEVGRVVRPTRTEEIAALLANATGAQ